MASGLVISKSGRRSEQANGGVRPPGRAGGLLEPAFDPPGLAGSLLEPDFGRLVALGPAVDFPSGTVGK
jgi:hypothetical protein